MIRRLFWFSSGVAAAPLAWGVAHVAYIAVDDWLHERGFRRSLGTKLAEVEDRLATLSEHVAEVAHVLLEDEIDQPLGADLLTAVEQAQDPSIHSPGEEDAP